MVQPLDRVGSLFFIFSNFLQFPLSIPRDPFILKIVFLKVSWHNLPLSIKMVPLFIQLAPSLQR